jgi:Flp pilus assembly protein TadD
LITGEIFDRQTRFWGVYSEVKIAANIRITRVSTGAVIWRGKHTAVVRDGGLPLNPLSIIGGTISAGMNLRDEQITRTTHDLARRLVTAIPNLKYLESDSDLAQKPISTPIDKSQSVHAFISGIENYPSTELLTELNNALGSDQWKDPSDRVVISEFLLKKDSKNTAAMFANASAKLNLSEPDAALSMSTRMLAIEQSNPEFLFLRGRALLQLNRPSEATEPLLKAVGADRTKAIYPTALGLAYNQIGNHELALASLNLSLKIEPDRPYALLQQGVAFVGIGDEPSAASALRRSMVLSIIAVDQRNASRALTLFKAMGLTEQISPEELSAFESKIESLLKNQ